MKLNGAAILIECLIEQNVGTVFGFPGGAVQSAHQTVNKNHKHEQQPFRQLVNPIAQLFQSFHDV